MSLGIYVHIPFCRSRCSYCHFVTSPWSGERAGRYREAVRREIEAVGPSAAGLGPVDSVYFGGGTPSLVPAEHIAGLLSTIRACLPVSDDCEVSLEANPETIGPDKAKAYFGIGVNRVSVGVQSFVDAELAAIGRTHDAEDSAGSLAALREAGFRNINLDLILGLPGQTLDRWRFSLERAVAEAPAHVSVYMLDIEDPGAPLHRAVANGLCSLPADDDVAEWYLEACEHFRRNGLPQYEISNFAALEFECRHNLKYWQREPVLGFGAGSHSFDGRSRYANVADIDSYIALVEAAGSAVEWRGTIDAPCGAEEAFFLGLRLNRGVDMERARLRYGVENVARIEASLAEMSACGLIEREGKVTRLTSRGRLLSNEVFSGLLRDPGV